MVTLTYVKTGMVLRQNLQTEYLLHHIIRNISMKPPNTLNSGLRKPFVTFILSVSILPSPVYFITVTFTARLPRTFCFRKKEQILNFSSFSLFQSNVILLLDTIGRALRRLILPLEEVTSKRPSWWNKEEAVRNTWLVQQIVKDFL